MGMKIVLVFSLLLNVLLSFLVWQGKGNKEKQINEQETYPLLSKRIFVENLNESIVNFYPLRRKLRELAMPWGDSFAFYFEYLPTGISIGVNEKTEIDSASLVKVPLVMAYYHQVENSGLEQKNPVVALEQRHIDSGFGDMWQRGVGAHVSVEEAIRLSLVNSDNTASNVVASIVSGGEYTQVYEGLDIDMTRNQDMRLSIGARSYASVLKALYLASVVNREHSQKILKYLTQTPFNDKLVAGVPSDIKVAHKIGIYQGKIYQDCGIVYVPSRPYLLCMMSHSNEDDARSRMVSISKTVYEYVAGVNP